MAQALFDMERPRAAGDAPPATLPGAVLALADRFDMLVGLFAVGAAPTGSSDPFGLRRAAAGVISILRAHPSLREITLSRGLSAAAEHVRAQGIEVAESTLDRGRRVHDRAVRAAAARRGPRPPARGRGGGAAARRRRTRRSRRSSSRVGDEDFGALVAALQRVRRIVPADTPAAYDPARLTEPAESALHQALVKVAESLGAGPHSLSDFVASATGPDGPRSTRSSTTSW